MEVKTQYNVLEDLTIALQGFIEKQINQMEQIE